MWLPAALLVGALLEGTLIVGALLVAVASAAAADSVRESSVPETQLVKNLREQLMRDNSDYSHEIRAHTDLRTRAGCELDTAPDNITSSSHATRQLCQPSAEDRDDGDTEDIVGGSEYKARPGVPVSEKDLLYYVDEQKLVSHKPEDRKYKTLKVRHEFRRSGQSQYIQEEGTGGVAILSLSRAPFPELRLPRSRRQYRHDLGQAATDDEGIPPPPPDKGISPLPPDEGIRPPPADEGIPPPPADDSIRPAAAGDVTEATAVL